jgi:peptidoglycan-associated lipoprotein
MKNTSNRLINSFSAVALVALIAGCSSTSLKETTGKVSDNPGKPATTVSEKETADPRSVSRVEADGNDLNAKGLLAKRSIYFDFDSFEVKPEFQSVLDAHGKNLIGNKNQKIIIQGNTDERGGREYNLALGAKRAESVRKVLNVMGVSDNQIETVSFGKEKPKATGRNEESYSENRRADIIYQ